MMTKREPNKNRIWERQRRSRLKTCFQSLCRILPSYDPCIVLSKIEILQRATVYIEELQNKNKELINNRVSAESQEKSQLKALEERVKILLNRTEQLASLLNDAGIKVPSEYGIVLPQTVRRWSNKISKQQAEEFLAKKNLEEANKSKTTSKIKKPSNNSSKISVPALKTKSPQKIGAKKNKKFVRIVVDNKIIKKKKLKQPKNNLPVITHLLDSSNAGKPVIVTQSNNTFTVFPNRNVLTLPVSQSLCINPNNTSKMTVSVPQQSIVLANTHVNKNAITNSQLLSAPIMATSITQSNLPISNFGAGTFILANGSILLPPTQTIIQPPPTILTAVLGNSQETNQTVVLVQNHKQKDKIVSSDTVTKTISDNSIIKSTVSETNGKPQKCLQKIIPKLGITNTTTVNKVPIPALTSKFSVSHTTKIVPKKTDISKKIENKSKQKENARLDIDKKEVKNQLNNSSKNSTVVEMALQKIEKKLIVDVPKDNRTSSVSKKLEVSDSSTNLNSKPDVEKDSPALLLLKRKNTDETLPEPKKNKNLESYSKDNTMNMKSDMAIHKVPSSDYSIDALCKNNSKDISNDVNNKNESLQKEITSNDCETGVTKSDELKANDNCDSVSNNKEQSKENYKPTDQEENKLVFEENTSVDSKVPKINAVSESNEKSIDEIKNPVSVPVTTSHASNSENIPKHTETLTLSLPHSELSNDIFASLQVPTGGQNPESISPTAAFLLSFPLVSTLTGGKITEAVEDENSDSPHGTPTLLQIGNIDSSKISQTDLTPNILALDNFSSFFSHKDYYTGSFSVNENGSVGINQKNNMLSPNKSITETRHSENKYLDFDHSESLQITNGTKQKDIKYLTSADSNLVPKKSLCDEQHITNTNCLYSESRLIPSTSGNIFNYEHLPIMHSNIKINMPVTSVSAENKSTSSHFNMDKEKINTTTKNNTEQPCENMIFTSANISKHTNTNSVPQNSSNSFSQTSNNVIRQNSNNTVPQNSNNSLSQNSNTTLSQNANTTLPQNSNNTLSQNSSTISQNSNNNNTLLHNSNNTPLSQNRNNTSLAQSANNNSLSQNTNNISAPKVKSAPQNHTTKNNQDILRTSSTVHNSSCMQSTNKQTIHHTEYTEPCQAFNNQFSIPNINNGKNVPTSHSNTNLIQPYYETQNVKRKGELNDNASNHLLQNKFDNNLKVKCKSDYVSSYQNIFNNDFAMPTFTYPDSKIQEKQIVSSTYYNDSNLSASYKSPKVYQMQSENKQFHKPPNISIYSQKPPVNWMTASPNTKPQSNTDYIFQPFGKESDYSQNSYFPTNNFASTTQTPSFFNSCNNLYQNMSTNSHINDTKKILPHNTFTRPDNVPSSDDNQFSWSPSKLPTFIDNPHNSLVLPSTLPTLMGDLALNTHSRSDKTYSNIENEQIKNINEPQKEIFSHKENKYKNKEGLNDQQQNVNTNFLSVSQLVEHNKTESTSQRPLINNVKKIPNNKTSKNNSTQKQNKRSSKSADAVENHSITANNLPVESYNAEKNLQDQHNKVRSQYLPTKIMENFENNTNSTNQAPVWLQEQSDKSTNRNNYKNSSSNYSAEALIGHNAISEHCAHPANKNNHRYNQHYSQTTKTSIANNPFVSDSIVSSFYPSVDLHTSQNTSQYYSQAHNNSLTYTTSSSVYQPSNFISNTPSIMSNYVSSSSLITEMDNDYQSQSFNSNSTSHIKNIIPKTNYNRSYAPPSLNKFEQRSHSNYVQSSDRKSNNQSCSINHTKRTTTKRKHSSIDTNITGFVDLGFLPMAATINSPISTEDPFHSHGNYLTTNSTQLYPTNNQNSLYPKPYSQTNHDFPTSHASTLLPLSTLPVNKNMTSQPEQSPNSNTTGTTLTNFNLSTIFPEINKPGTIPVPGIYSESHRASNILPSAAALHSSVNYSNLLNHTPPQVGLNNKTTYLPLSNIGNTPPASLQFPNVH